ncbi:restriction endonuclease subunit S [Lutispora sp.]|uniref:restriction endonuclease subunit S n=1 Tax=Lutispora sp. TaxID=2828727 RepID=UPI002B20191C|nr:restriction endonuclease subunit S [Lutispora sp.]MEA4962606.1 restriction endonuclease subunit S [Lutispora sp.]
MNKNEKMTLVPNLRFPEFGSAGEWQVSKLDEIAGRLTEKVGDRQLTTLSISAGVGFVSQAEKFSRDISGKQYENYIFLKKGDFSYNKGNSKKFPQGCIYELKEYDEAAVPNAFISFRFYENYVSSFYKGYFENNFHGKQLKKFITSGARSDGLLNINPSDFFSIILPTPRKKEEQQKIADCLSSLDDLITAEGKKLEALRAHKKGLMQKLFPAEGKTLPECRFPEYRNGGQWKIKSLGSKAIKVGSGATPLGGEANYKNSGRPFIRSQNVGWGYLILDNIAYIDEATHQDSISTEVHSGDMLLNITGASIGRCAVADYRVTGGNVNQHVCIIRTKVDELSPWFLNQYLLSVYGQKQIESFQAGGNRQGLNFAQIRSFSVPIPSIIEEQYRIADCLTSLDDLIAAQTKKIDTYNEHKKGLMQGLFPSIEEVGE